MIRLLSLAALLPALALAACASPTVPEIPVDDALEHFYIQGAERTADSVAAWALAFEAAGCSPTTAGTDAACSTALADGGLLALEAQIVLEGGGIAEHVREPLEPSWRAAQAAAASSTAFSDAGCPGEVTEECARLAEAAAADLLALHDELSSWRP